MRENRIARFQRPFRPLSIVSAHIEAPNNQSLCILRPFGRDLQRNVMLLERNIRRCKGRKRLRERRNGSGPTTANENGRGNYAVPRFSGDRWGQFCEPHLLHSEAVALNFSVDWNEGIGIPHRISFVRVRHQLDLIGTYGTTGTTRYYLFISTVSEMHHKDYRC